jgi:hypothetical protein
MRAICVYVVLIFTLCLFSCIELIIPKEIHKIAYTGNPKERELEFLRRLSDLGDRPVTFADGCKAIYLLKTDKFPIMSYEEVRHALIRDKIIPEFWNYPKEKILLKGEYAYMLCRALELKGGLSMHIFGPIERYCLNECIYRGFLLRGRIYDHVSGKEIIGSIQRAADYKEKTA